MRMPMVVGGILLLTSNAYVNAMEIQTNGFLNVGVIKSNLENSIYRGDLSTVEGVTDELDYSYLNTLGLQFTGVVNDDIKLITQLVARGNYNNYEVNAEWAYGSIEVTPELTIRAGRLRAAMYALSDYLDIGYAYKWVTPPTEVYWQIPFSTMNGIDAFYTSEVGDWSLTTQLFAGDSDTNVSGTNYQVSDIYGLSLLATDFTWTVRGVVSSSNTSSSELTTLLEGIQAYLEATGQSTDPVVFDDDRGTFLGLYVAADFDPFSFNAEYVHRKIDGVLQDPKGWYLTGAYRLGDWTPYVSYAHTETTDKDERRYSQGDANGDAIDEGFTYWNFDQDTLTLGLRWDFAPAAAVKLEWQETTAADGMPLLAYQASDPNVSIKDESIAFWKLALNIVF